MGDTDHSCTVFFVGKPSTSLLLAPRVVNLGFGFNTQHKWCRNPLRIFIDHHTGASYINLGTANGGMEYLRQRNNVTPISGCHYQPINLCSLVPLSRITHNQSTCYLIHNWGCPQPTYQLVICSNLQPRRFISECPTSWDNKLGTAYDANTISQPPMITENHHAYDLRKLITPLLPW